MRRQAKALVAGAIAGLSALAPVVDDGLAPSEGLTAAAAAFVAWRAVYWTPNRRAQARE